jgi:outer membrane protein insertion porin family
LRALLTALLLLGAAIGVRGQDAAAKVTELNLRGHEYFTARQLRRVMTSAPRFLRKKRFHQATLSSDLNAVLAVYEGEGFLDARVVARNIVPSVDGSSVAITVELEEGPRTTITSLTLSGAEQIDAEELFAMMRLQEAAPFRRQRLLTDHARLEALYAERGMITTRIGYEAVVDTIGSARVAYQVTEGPVVKVGEIVVNGLDKTRRHVVLRELRLKPGDRYRRSQLAETQTAIFSTGLFRNVTVSPAPGNRQDSIRALVVTVRERAAGSLDLGVGYGSSERLRAGLALAQTNWLGRSLRVGANVRASRLLRTAEGVFTVPYVLGRHVALDGRLFQQWERNPEAAFRTRKTGTAETFSYQWQNSWVSEVSYTLERVRLRLDAEERYQPAQTSSSLSLALRRDSRDNPLDSRMGSMLRLRADVAGGPLGGASDFNRSTVELLHFRPVWFAIAAIHAQASGIDASGANGRVATYDQFFLGGDRSVRGYGRGEIGADRVGELAFNMQLELRLPVFSHGLVLFHDAGQVWTEAADVDLPGDLRGAHGAGLRYDSRFGMLRLDVALAQRQASTSQRLGVYFGVGQAF